MNENCRIIRTSTVPYSLVCFCGGMMEELVNAGYEVIGVSSPGNILDEFGQGKNVRTHSVSMERQIAPLKDLKSLWWLIKIFRKEHPQIVHSMTPKAGLLSMMAAWICRVPVRVHTFTGLLFPTSTGLRQKILIFTDFLTCVCATHIVPEGEGVKRDLINYKITKKPLKVLGHGNIRGINLRYYDSSLNDVITEASKIRNSDKFTFLFVGRLVGDKGINDLVVAFNRLQKELSSIRLLLVGPEEQDLDPLKPETVAAIERNPAIEAAGYQNDVRPWYVAADCFVFPSYREGFPNVVIEAGAMGLPSIVTDINGSREIIIEGENGTIIPPRDVDALYSAMRRMATDEPWRRSLAANARQLVADRYEQGYVRRCLLDFYKEILQKDCR